MSTRSCASLSSHCTLMHTSLLLVTRKNVPVKRLAAIRSGGLPQVGVDGELGLAGHRAIEHVLPERVAAGVGRRRPPPPQCAQSAW
jgi:hypothetical protein